jgi:hypothetical protein
MCLNSCSISRDTELDEQSILADIYGKTMIQTFFKDRVDILQRLYSKIESLGYEPIID